MRAEDLFEAIGELDEQLVALSEEDGQRARKTRDTRDHQKEVKRKRKKRAEIYRFAAIAMTTAAAVFAVLMARDLLTARNMSYSQTAAETAYADSAAESVQDTEPGVLASGAAPDQESAAMEPDADTAAKSAAAKEAEAAESAGEAEEDAVSDKVEENAVADAAEEIGEAAEEIAEAEESLRSGDTGKTAVDLLGDLKGGYVKLEFISAQDAANGGETSVPEYSKEREEALSSALQNGQKRAAMFTDEGAPIYYVYLTRTDGKVDIVTFYEKGYVSMNTVPGVVLKLSDEAFAAVMEVFEE